MELAIHEVSRELNQNSFRQIKYPIITLKGMRKLLRSSIILKNAANPG